MSAPRRALFYAFMGAVTLVGLEVGALLVEFGHRLITGVSASDFVEWDNPAPIFRAEIDLNGSWMYKRTTDHWVQYNYPFPVDKPDDVFRFFCLGGSAAMGWPHWLFNSYPYLLKRKLEALYPDRRFEPINAAGNTYGSHRVKVVFDEIVGYDPDLVVIYSGNNEFLESLVYAPPPWRRLALTRIVGAAIGRRPRLDAATYGGADQAVNQLSFAFGSASRLREDPEQFAEVLAHYRFNIEAMVRGSRRRGIPVMLVNVPVNLRDWVPNVSLHRDGLAPDELARWRSEFRTGLETLEAGDPEGAAEALRRAVEIDDTHAETRFWLGKALLATGRLDEAKRDLRAALEWDAYPFRSIPQFDEILGDIARQHGVPLVDAAGAVARSAEDGLSGYDVLTDYVHPTIQSNEAIAHEVLVRILEAGILPVRDAEAVAATRFEVQYHPREEFHALRAVYGQMLIMRQYGRLRELGERVVEYSQRDVPDAEEARTFAVTLEQFEKVLEPYERLLRAEKLGTVEAEFTPEQARETFEAYAEFIRAREAANMPEAEFRAFLDEKARGR